MSEETKHTPGPWEIGTFDEYEHNKAQTFAVITPEGEFSVLAYVFAPKCNKAEGEANGEFIIRACNSHKALLDACKELLGLWWNSVSKCAAEDCSVCVGNAKKKEAFEAVIALAEKGA